MPLHTAIKLTPRVSVPLFTEHSRRFAFCSCFHGGVLLSFGFWFRQSLGPTTGCRILGMFSVLVLVLVLALPCWRCIVFSPPFTPTDKGDPGLRLIVRACSNSAFPRL